MKGMNAFKMRSAKAFKFQSLYLIWRLIPCTILALLLCLYFYPLTSNTSSSPPTHHHPHKKQCDYFNGKWVPDRTGPLYNGTTCGATIQASHNCIINGRPDSEYIYWRWKPRGCNLPRFDPNTFLQLIKNKHVAFVGDSLARNQLESLLCMLSSVSTPKIDLSKGWWHFPSHNATLSLYWAPFLVEGFQRQLKGPGPNNNTMHLDQVNQKWARDMDQMDLIMLGFGHWFVNNIPSVYYEGGSVLGCQNFPGLNCTDIGIYIPIRKALRTALNSIIEKKAAKGHGVGVIVRTIAPSHFKGTWDKGGTCSMTKPYEKGKKRLQRRDAKIRKIGIEELQNAQNKAKQFGGGFRFEVLDVTKLALMRPDGHPGPYMNLFPFAKGVPEYVQSDCSHWCLPGPIDTWNEIFLEMMKNWEEQSKSEE